MTALLAQTFFSGTVVHYAIAIVIVAAVVGIVLVALHQFGIAVPPFVINVLWIVLCAVVCIVGIKFIAGIF